MPDSTDSLVTRGSDPDPRVGLQAVAALARLQARLEELQVDHARALGWSWADIAAELGVSKQAAHKKHSRRS